MRDGTCHNVGKLKEQIFWGTRQAKDHWDRAHGSSSLSIPKRRYSPGHHWTHSEAVIWKGSCLLFLYQFTMRARRLLYIWMRRFSSLPLYQMEKKNHVTWNQPHVDFPGNLGVKTLCFHCRATGSLRVHRSSACCMMWPEKKKGKINLI